MGYQSSPEKTIREVSGKSAAIPPVIDYVLSGCKEFDKGSIDGCDSSISGRTALQNAIRVEDIVVRYKAGLVQKGIFDIMHVINRTALGNPMLKHALLYELNIGFIFGAGHMNGHNFESEGTILFLPLGKGWKVVFADVA
jgi:hypothetical protein